MDGPSFTMRCELSQPIFAAVSGVGFRCGPPVSYVSILHHAYAVGLQPKFDHYNHIIISDLLNYELLSSPFEDAVLTT